MEKYINFAKKMFEKSSTDLKNTNKYCHHCSPIHNPKAERVFYENKETESCYKEDKESETIDQVSCTEDKHDSKRVRSEDSIEVIFDSRNTETSDKNFFKDSHSSIVALKKSLTNTKYESNVQYQDEKNGPDTGFMDWKRYHRLEVIHSFLEDLEQRFPAICTVANIGKSLEQRDLKMLKISNSIATNASVWIDAGIHAREWIAPAVATYIANHIANNFETLPEFMTNKDWYFLPVVNPDGYEYTHTNERMWRKNKAKVQGQYIGVDLNRNFSYGWGGRGSSNDPKHSFYRGPKPFSEPESSAMRDMILNSDTPFKVYITLHSFGQVIIFPLACQDNICPDYIRLLQGATVMSKAIYKCNGNIYKVGISKDVMYLASGTSNDWSYGEAKIPFCYLIELRSRKHKFKLPQEEIEETGNEILNCLKELMEFVDNYCPLDADSKENFSSEYSFYKHKHADTDD